MEEVVDWVSAFVERFERLEVPPPRVSREEAFKELE
jgi:hypothetical protein